MPRHERLDFKDAVHYVRLRGAEGSEIFFQADSLRGVPHSSQPNVPHALRFEHQLAATCTECGTILHGYSLEPNSAILVLQSAGSALQAFMQRLCSQYSRYLRAGGFVPGHGVFGGRYDSKVVAPEYLPHAVRRAHRSPVAKGLCNQRVDYPFSSDRRYSGEAASVPIYTCGVVTALELKGYFGSRGYREFMDQDETRHVANLLSRGSPLDPRIVGDKVFVQKARHRAEKPTTPSTPEQLIAEVARLLNVTPGDIYSATYVGTLGRALVAWYGVRSGAATLRETGQWFSVTGATLGQGIRYYRKRTPDLFNCHGCLYLKQEHPPGDL
jgi:hypothetical protein